MIRGRRNPLYFGLPGRLRKARKQAELSRRKLAESAGLAHTAVYYIEDNGTTPRIDIVEKLAAVLQVSPCFLAYGTVLPFVATDTLRSNGVGPRLRSAREGMGLSKSRIAEAAKVARGTVLYLEEGSTLPTVATAEQLAKALGVSPCWLAFGDGEGPEKADR